MRSILIAALMLCAFGLLAYPGRSETKIGVLKTGNLVSIRSCFSPEQDLVIQMHAGSNRQVSYLKTSLIPGNVPLEQTQAAALKAPASHQTGDDTPVYLANGSYFGGNHAGCYGIAVNTKKPHGLTDADVGSQWKDGAGTIFNIIKIINPTQIWVLSENGVAKPDWKFVTKLNPSSFENAATQKKLEIKDSYLRQLHPGSRILEQEYLVDGKTPLVDGKPVICDSLVIRDVHDVIAPDSLLEHIKKNPGKKADFTAPEIENQTTRNFVYTFLPKGVNLIHLKTKLRRDLSIAMETPIMTVPMNRNIYSLYEYYIPDTVPLKGDHEERIYDFNSIQNMKNPIPSTVCFRSPNNMPDRFIQLFGNGKERQIGFAMGMDPLIGLGKKEEIAKNTYMSAYIYKTGKTYPGFWDGRTKSKAGDVLESFGYRCYLNPKTNPDATCVYSYQNGKTGMLYADFHKSVQDVKIALPPAFQGKKVSVVRSTGNASYQVKEKDLWITIPEKQGSLILKFD